MTLDEYLTEQAETAMAFAGRINVSPSTITRLRNGESWPDPPTMSVIIAATGGKVTLEGLYRAWMQAKGLPASMPGSGTEAAQ